ncbi:MAG: response regulator transcription factor [Calditrichia bacterium]|nr:response regulator transcription factor [Calditrichia bacterium]
MSPQNKNEFSGSRVLLVEDEETMGMGLEYNLAEEGYQVTWAKDGRQALDIFFNDKFDLVILDIMLPFYDGFEVAEKIREKSPQIPILMLTARSGIRDKIKGLAVGGDDYLTKPFHLKELLLRVKGMLKRKQWYKTFTNTPEVYQFGNNEVNFENLSCRQGNKSFRLTPHEALVLKYLVDRKGKIVSREELLENVWNINSQVETRTVDNFIVRLRKYFEPDPSHPIYFKSIRGAGYMFSD